ncbi:peptidase M24 family protein [Actinomycetota bacterium]|nr:peptidase M24 family protein [Actinomycetota bacterium]
MKTSPSKQELLARIQNLHSMLSAQGANWDAAIVVDRVNQFYLTDTMQDGLFFLMPDGSYAYFVRKSFERACEESSLDNIFPMSGYKDAFAKIGSIDVGFIETEIMPVAMLNRIQKYFGLQDIKPLDAILKNLRSVKSAYELSVMEESGRKHKHFLEQVIPEILRESISEAQLTAQSYARMVDLGYQGVCRFTMFQAELVIGQLGFGESSLYPFSFDGPGGSRGLCNAVQTMGSAERLLKKGDLVFVDVGFGIGGYHTDRTQVYLFGGKPSAELVQAHQTCLEVQKKAAAMLVPGAIPEEIYQKALLGLSPEFLQNFMGYPKPVKFLGHGVGLYVDEYPVIAPDFTTPLKENMTIALEPKKGIAGLGMVGVEDTYVVTKNGGRCITGGEREIMEI